jgi:DNA polymerase III subunit epsilon
MFGVPIELVVGGLVLAGLGLLTALLLAERSSGRRAAQRRRHPLGAAVPAPRPPVQVTEPEGPLPFAEPGMRGRLFQYGGDGPGFPVDAPYAVIDVETTGFSPAAGDRIVEVAIARVDAHGRIEDEYATLVDPGRDVGPVFVHGISNTEVLGAPTFADIAGELLDRMDGAVVVAHNATFEERFLAAEFARMGLALPLNPALCSLWLARRTLQAPNHKLTTLARATGLSTAGAHTALGDVRTVAALLPQMLVTHGEPLRYLTGLRRLPALDRGAPPRTRAVDLRAGTGGWLSAMMARLPMSAAEAREADVQRYLDALTVALADGRIVGGEAQQLARLAGSAGLGATQVASLHRRFLEHIRAAALEDAILTTGELRQLKTAASGLGLPDYFDDLRPTSPQDVLAARLR